MLSNPELRAKYDKHGAAGLDVDFMDPSMIFGEHTPCRLCQTITTPASCRNSMQGTGPACACE